MRSALWIGLATVVAAAPAYAESVPVNASAGRVADVAVAIARQTGSSIVVADRALADRKVPAMRGRMTAAEAVERLARAARARAIPAGSMSWRLVPAASAEPRAQRAQTPLGFMNGRRAIFGQLGNECGIGAFDSGLDVNHGFPPVNQVSAAQAAAMRRQASSTRSVEVAVEMRKCGDRP